MRQLNALLLEVSAETTRGLKASSLEADSCLEPAERRRVRVLKQNLEHKQHMANTT